MLDKRYKVLKFIPFDPSSKRTEAVLEDQVTNKKFIATKGVGCVRPIR
jgi:magnesium-transporting ATPase (P-type)